MDKIEITKKEMLSKKTWAVVGATADETKFGYKIFKKLKKHDYQVYGINPKYDDLEGEKLYQSLKELPIVPECVNVVVNPKVAMALLEEIKQLGIKYVWFQPGAFDEQVIDQAEAYGLNIVYYDCVLVALAD